MGLNLRSVLAVLALLLAAGCGGGSAEKIHSVQFLGSDPADGATGVPVTRTTIRVFVDRDLSVGTVNGNNVFVTQTGIGGPLNGTVGYDSAARAIVWQLAPGQQLNSFLPASDVLAFEQFYTITVTQGVRSLRQEPPTKTFQARFQSTGLVFSPVPQGSDPQPGTTTALVDPGFDLVGAQVVPFNLRFKFDVPLDPVSVTQNASSVSVVEGGPGGTPIDGAVTFDASTNTVYWTATPVGNSPNPNFIGEPILKTATAYMFVLSGQVRTATTPPQAPKTDTQILFTTTSLPIRKPTLLPFGVTFTADLKLNEVLPDPGNTTVTGDANGDGIVSEGHDEFVEIINTSGVYLNLAGLEIRDSNTLMAVLPGMGTGNGHKSLLAPGRAIVVYGGGNPSPARRALLRSKVHTGQNPSTSGTFANTATVEDARVTDVGGGSNTNYMVDRFTGPYPGDSSLTRNPDVTGLFTPHKAVTPGVNFSPGRKTTSQLFGD